MLVLGAQSCAVYAGSSVVSGLSTEEAEKEEADEDAGGAALGILAALLWLVAAALVLARPRVSMWIFVAAAVACLLGALTGFVDLYVWAVVSLVFALMSWRGAKEKAKDEVAKQSKYEADIEAAAARLQAQPAPAPPPAQDESRPDPG